MQTTKRVAGRWVRRVAEAPYIPQSLASKQIIIGWVNFDPKAKSDEGRMFDPAAFVVVAPHQAEAERLLKEEMTEALDKNLDIDAATSIYVDEFVPQRVQRTWGDSRGPDAGGPSDDAVSRWVDEKIRDLVQDELEYKFKTITLGEALKTAPEFGEALLTQADHYHFDERHFFQSLKRGVPYWWPIGF